MRGPVDGERRRHSPPRAAPDRAPRSRPAPAGNGPSFFPLPRPGARSSASNPRVSSAGAGPDLEHVAAGQVARKNGRRKPARRAILAVRFRSSRKFCPSAFFFPPRGMRSVGGGPRDHLAQGGQAVDGAHAATLAAKPRPGASASAQKDAQHHRHQAKAPTPAARPMLITTMRCRRARRSPSGRPARLAETAPPRCSSRAPSIPATASAVPT